MLSETPKPSTKKTKLAHSRKYWSYIVAITILSVACLVVWFFASKSNNTISINEFSIEVVNNLNARAQGLSGRTSFDKNQAMIFDFSDGSDGRCFWMKDMNFDIDIIWLDATKRVKKIVANASPKSYPESFCSNKNPVYVVELAAGRANELGITKGSRLAF